MAVSGSKETYLNPVYGLSFPDPFVLKYCGVYYAYSTGHAPDGRLFELLTSRDLVEWTSLGGAMQPLATEDPFYWAPEVTYHEGKFYLYYSVGNETLMTLRVAVSDRPDTGFVDAGIELTQQDFAIDAHVFRDDDGSWWMFYATDFLDHRQIGTGTVVDRMIDMFMLAGDPKPVTRARYDWQVYDPARKEKGGVRWHTVEGPFVLKRKGTYYEMFSGGNWQNISYGVSFAVSDTIQNADEWLQYSDGETTFPLIRTIPEKVIGPGHNSVIRGPNNRELYCVYHRWVDDNRVLAIDRMDFGGGDRMFISGPTHTPQPAPYQPATFIAAGRSIDLDAGLRFLLETSFTGTPTIELKLVDDSSFEVPMPSVTNDVTHHVLLEVDALYADIRVDGTRERVVALPEIVRSVHLNGKAKFFGTAMTTGYELLFEDDKLDERGWSRAGNVSFNKGELYIENGRIESAVLTNDDSELVVNIAFDAGTRIDIEFGGSIILFGHDLYIGDEKVPLPDGFTSEVFHQFRFVKKAGYIDSFLDNIRVAEGVTAARSVRMLISVNGSAKLDMIRSTAI